MRQKVVIGKGRNLSPSAVTGGREHIHKTQESRKHSLHHLLCAQSSLRNWVAQESWLCFYPLKLLNVSAKDQLLSYLIIIKLMCAHCRKCKGGNGREG